MRFVWPQSDLNDIVGEKDVLKENGSFDYFSIYRSFDLLNKIPFTNKPTGNNKYGLYGKIMSEDPGNAYVKINYPLRYTDDTDDVYKTIKDNIDVKNVKGALSQKIVRLKHIQDLRSAFHPIFHCLKIIHQYVQSLRHWN